MFSAFNVSTFAQSPFAGWQWCAIASGGCGSSTFRRNSPDCRSPRPIPVEFLPKLGHLSNQMLPRHLPGTAKAHLRVFQARSARHNCTVETEHKVLSVKPGPSRRNTCAGCARSAQLKGGPAPPKRALSDIRLHRQVRPRRMTVM